MSACTGQVEDQAPQSRAYLEIRLSVPSCGRSHDNGAPKDQTVNQLLLLLILLRMVNFASLGSGTYTSPFTIDMFQQCIEDVIV